MTTEVGITSTTHPGTVRPVAAAAWMMGAVGSFTLMAVAARAVSTELDTFEVLAWRSIMGAIVMVLVIWQSGLWSEINLSHPSLQLARNLCHFIAQNLWFYALFTIPLAQVFALEFTAPLWALVLSRLLLGERLTTPRMIAGMLGFAGILLVAQPGAAPITPGLLAAAAAAVGFAFTYIMTKKLTDVAHIACILLWMTVSQALFGFICASIDGDIAFPSLNALPWIAVIGITGLAAHYCIGKALKLAPATVVMPFDFLRLPVIVIIGMIFYNEPVGYLVIAGAALILFGNYLNIRSESRNN